MDISCPTCGNTTESEKIQTQMYETVLKACLSVPQCKNFETWGYTDKYTWRGSNEYPLPFDIDFKPKMVAYGLQSVLLNTSFIENAN